MGAPLRARAGESHGALSLKEQIVLRKIDCVMIRVDNIEVAAAYYAKVFGLLPQWSRDDSIGLAFLSQNVST